MPAGNRDELNVGNPFSQRLGVLNRDDSVIHSPENLDWPRKVAQRFDVIPRVAKHESDGKERKVSGSHVGQGVERNDQGDFVWRDTLPRQNAGGTAANRFTQDTNRDVGMT